MGAADLSAEQLSAWVDLGQNAPGNWSPAFRVCKRITDVFVASLALPVLGFVAVALLLVNPIYNRGPLFFCQPRAGKGGRSFCMWKFRTMEPAEAVCRAPDAPVEDHRITPLGSFLRRYRLDELPNFINVLRGEMSVVGPRPDAIDHSEHFASTIPGYRDRARVLPGITGLAQVEAGYAEGAAATARKVEYDRLYIANSCLRLEAYILLKTCRVILTGFGGR